ncbi:sperm flagellar protein 2-like [Leuresthes tenuis]|uniref:sperm flagellar protein 2-like n=1 Tax=Leuresthes tenuis TaxID=355514 RepID=UPI003B50E73E
MSEFLSRWLNQELRLSKPVEPRTFAKDFSNGYLIGEILHKYQMQDGFSLFLRKSTSISKVNNFTRLEPTLKLLGIPFNINTAQDLMQEKPGVATQLLHQLYIALEKKKNEGLTKTMMEIMQPTATANLHRKEHELYSYRLPQVVKRDADMKLQKVSQYNRDKCQQLTDLSVGTTAIEQKRQLKVQDEKRVENKEKVLQSTKSNKVCPGHEGCVDTTCELGTNVQVPKVASCTSPLKIKREKQQQQYNKHQEQIVQNEIAQFEAIRKKLTTSAPALSSSSSGQPLPLDFTSGGSKQDCKASEGGTKLMLQSNTKYLQEVRKRLKDNASTSEQQQRRLDRFLVEQFKAREAEQEVQREKQLVKCLTRPTKQEQRLVAQLMQIRQQKQVILENQLFKEQQCQQRREKDFQEALHSEAVLAQEAKLAHAEEIRKELEFCNRTAAERAHSRHKKHSESCKDIVGQIVDLVTKVGEHRQLTGSLVPGSLMREWKELLFRGLALYEPTKSHQPELEFSSSLDPAELKKQEILNNLEYDEYTRTVGEWAWPEEAEETNLPLTANNILAHVIQQLKKMVHPPVLEPSSPLISHFAIKACILGKLCTGKTTCLAKITEALGIRVLSADTLITEALQAYKNESDSSENQQATEQQGETDNGHHPTSMKSDDNIHVESRNFNAKLSRATHGAAAEKEMRKGNAIPNELLVDIMVEAISQLPAESGWILDGFPYDISLAHLLEKALGGSVDEGNEVVNNRSNFADDPDSPGPPPSPAPVLDLVLLLDIPDECVVRRAYSYLDTDTAAKTFHPRDKILYQAQIPHRISAFQETWPALEKWFGEKQNILVRLDADVDEGELYGKVESILQQVLQKKQKDIVPESIKAPDTSPTPNPPEDQPPALSEQEGDPTESLSSLQKEEVQSEWLLYVPYRGFSGDVPPSSLSNEDSKGDPKNFSESPSSDEGSSNQVYLDLPLPLEIAEYLFSNWDTACDSYVNDVKKVMQQLRSQRTVIDHQLFNIRERYKHFLQRPDLKQELVSKWQKDFNNIPDDMREDEDTKAELHLRLDELREPLWDISDKRKEEDEKERAAIMCNGWLEDHATMLINHHSILMQVELSLFQQTLRTLRVYYWSMYMQVPLTTLPESSYIHLLEKPAIKDQDESWPDSSEAASKKADQDESESEKLIDEKVISVCEEAVKSISQLVSAEAQQRPIKEQKEGLQEKEEKKTENSNTAQYKKQPSKKEKVDLLYPYHLSPFCSPPTPSDDSETPDQERVEKINKEYAAALSHEGNVAKVRIELVKGHNQMMVRSLQRRAQEIFSNMEKLLQACYLADMKCIDQLTEVVRHHIEAGSKLQYELVLEDSDFYLNGDCLFVASPAPPPRPPPLEKPLQSTPTITQLESLHHQLYSIAPSGLMSSLEFCSLLTDMVSISMGRNTLPVPWVGMNETKLKEIVSLLTDDYELIDWRRFLLSAALPWPFPSLTQLLDVLQSFKVADAVNTGYVNEEQYLQIQLWFSSEMVKTVPEDPSEPLPYDRLANLHKFFFQLFADHTFSPPRLDYVSMLLYFAADPNPRQGFIRALLVASGQHLKQHSQCHLVKSMPSIGEARDVTFVEVNRDYKEEDTLFSSSFLWEQEVSIPTLLNVTCHKVTMMKNSSPLPPGCLSEEEHTEHLVHVYTELGYEPEDCVPFSILSKHPHILMLMETLTHYQLVNIHRLILAHQEEGEANCLTIS